MSVLGVQDAEAIASALEDLERDVDVVLVLGPAASPVTLLAAGGAEVDTAAETLRLVEAVCALGDRVHLEVVERDEPGPWPQLTIGDGLVYRGMPLGYELAALVYAIVEAGRRASTLTAESLGQLAGLTRPVELRVYVTPT